MLIYRLYVDRFSQCNSITIVQNAFVKLYSCVIEIKMKEFEDGYGPPHAVCFCRDGKIQADKKQHMALGHNGPS